MLMAAVCWSFGGLLIRFMPWHAMSIVGTRALFAALVFSIWRKSIKIRFTRGHVIAAVCLALTTNLFVFSNQLTTAAAAVLLQFTVPVWVIFLELIFFKKKPSVSSLVAVVFTISGMMLFFAEHLEAGNMLGNILAILSGLSFAGVFVCNTRAEVDTEQSILLGFLINAVIGLPFIFIGTTADPAAWGAAIFLGVVQVGLAYVFFSKGIRLTSALLACLITAIEPVLNPIWVALVFGEIPGPFALAGGAVIIITIVTYNIWIEIKHVKAK
jgi:drug/metabolite transporter (DMT)-like permease